MTVVCMARSSGPEHASAARRLARARDRERRAVGLVATTAGTLAAPPAESRLSAAHADVAARRQWLHWIDEGESLAPWADGEWAPQAPIAALPARAVTGVPRFTQLGPDPEPPGMRFAALAELARRA
jgi:hypothetical protein